MFTGVIEAKGRVRGFSGGKFELDGGALARGMKIGGSLAVNGACLTLVSKKGSRLSFNVVPETLRRTGLGRLKPGDAVNLERALRAGSRVEGHFVLGHVDGAGRVEKVRAAGNGRDFFVSFPPALRGYLFEKGSVALDGISLTLGKVTAKGFWVHLVPHTLRKTVSGAWRAGSPVNVEADVLAKLATRL
jgi:riboflavin synthase